MPIKNIVLFITGLGISSVGTLFAVKNHYKTFYENRCDEDIQSYKEWCKDNIMKLAEHELGSGTKVNPVENQKEAPKPGEPDYQAIIEKLNYGDFSKKEEPVPEKKELDKPEIDEQKGPYIIGPDDFANDSIYDKVTLVYFSEDDTFMTVEEEVLKSGAEMVGRENLEHFGEIEPNVVYVRNEVQGVDYEVILEERSYQESEYAAGNYEEE